MSNSYTLHNGDCLEIIPTLAENSVDTIITDPPYGLSFMGKDWDHGIPGPRFWCEALRVAKPGAMLLAFGGTRTFHRLAVAIEDAGWEIRDTLMWVYGSGFPKSHDISKAIDKAAGAERDYSPGPYASRRPKETVNANTYGANGSNAPGNKQSAMVSAPATDAARTWDGYGTALKPAWEPIILAMKPLDGTFAANALEHGVAGLWIDGGRVGTEGATKRSHQEPYGEGGRGDQGGAQNWRIGHDIVSLPPGRWPANLIHDGSDEVTGLFPVTTSGKMAAAVTRSNRNGYAGAMPEVTGGETYGDTGSAARFFYCAKASRSERNAGLEGMEERQKYAKNGQGGSHEIFTSESASDSDWAKKHPNHPQANHHPTVKPLALMRYLAKLTRTPSGGVVLDPFMGSGSTGAACMYEGRDFIGIEQDEDYTEIARRRIEHHRQEAVREQRQPALFEGNV